MVPSGFLLLIYLYAIITNTGDDAMIARTVISTERLELIPATPDTVRCEGTRHQELGRLLDAEIPDTWPPPLLDPETREQFIALLSGGTDRNFCSWYWITRGSTRNERVLIGSGGTGSCSSATDAVMIGYSVLDEFQNRGYATEAVRHSIPVIFADPGIRRIVAATCPELKASVRVLEKNGFVRVAEPLANEGLEEGTLCYQLERP